MALVKIRRNLKNNNKSIRITLFWLFHVECGFHYLSGYHMNAGLGFGPCEVSMSLHTWEKW
tara:strand:- start:125 stop:307 length:183 start_codon:yes stop_codon:yes gene_type:complete